MSLVPSLADPVFIVGSPRSGTTFLGAALARSPLLAYHFEPVLTKAAAPYVYFGLWTPARAARFYRRVYRWLDRLRLDGDLRFVDKTPRNALLVPFLADTFPDARFIHIVRDGRDVAASWSERPWLGETPIEGRTHEPGGYRYGPHPRMWVEPDRVEEFRTTSTVHRCAWGWRRHVEAVQQASARLSEGRLLEIRYESLVGDPERVGGEVLDFLGIESDAVLAALGGIRGTSIGRWRDLSDADLAAVMRECGSLLRQLGYIG
jgi:hypothetical protein